MSTTTPSAADQRNQRLERLFTRLAAKMDSLSEDGEEASNLLAKAFAKAVTILSEEDAKMGGLGFGKAGDTISLGEVCLNEAERVHCHRASKQRRLDQALRVIGDADRDPVELLKTVERYRTAARRRSHSSLDSRDPYDGIWEGAWKAALRAGLSADAANSKAVAKVERVKAEDLEMLEIHQADQMVRDLVSLQIRTQQY